MKVRQTRGLWPANQLELLALVWLVPMMVACGERVEVNESGPPASEIVEYRGVRVFTGEGFVETRLCVGGRFFVDRPQDVGPGGGLDPELLPRVARLSEEAGLRLAVANSSLGDFRASVAAGADMVSHLPCYMDTMSDGESPYYRVDTNDG